MYLQPRRTYRNIKTGKTSLMLADVIDGTITIYSRFSVGVRRGWWMDAPFKGIDCPRPSTAEIEASFDLTYEPDSVKESVAVPILFQNICDSIEGSWRADKFHVVFASAGYDSRIISAAIKTLMARNGDDWLGRGLLFLSNRWEAREFTEMMQRQGWQSGYYAAYTEGRAEDHFNRCLNFKTYWHEVNAPVPLAGNLWWYLPDWAQRRGLIPGDDECQGYSGYWANETWHSICSGGIKLWVRNLKMKYSHHVMAALPYKIPLMEFPLTDTNVLRVLPAVKDGEGKTLREAVAAYASPEVAGLENPAMHDREHPISSKAQEACWKAYRHSWYYNVERGHPKLETSGFSNDWGRWGLASLCQYLKGRGVNVRVE